jgi:outer membrane protein assembly factor BamB
MRLPAIAVLLAALLIPLAAAVAQETERTGPPPMVWVVPRLQLYLEEGDRELFRGIDASFALPLTPRLNVTATYSWDIDLADRISAALNYDHPLGEGLLLRGSAGIVREHPSLGVTLHRSFREFGVGAFARNVEGEVEAGLMLTRAVPWGLKLGRPRQLRRRESPDWPSGAGNVGDLGACAALVYHAGGTPDELFTTTAYFPRYGRHSWPREGQSVQGVAYASSDFPPPVTPTWHYQTAGPIRTSAAIVDGVAYIGSYDGSLYALDVVLGRRLWSFPAGAPITGAPAWLDGRLYFGTEAGDILCVAQPRKNDPPTGRLIWRYSTGATVTASPLVTESGMVIAGSCDGYIHALDRASGKPVWKLSTGGPILASASKLSRRIPAGVDSSGQPTFRSAGVLVGSSDGRLYAIEEVKGQVIWTFTTDGPITATAVASGERIFVGNRSGSVYALDGGTGKQLWVTRVAGSIAYPPAADEERVYVTTGEGQVHALAAATGRELWRNDLRAATAAAPTLVQGKLMYIASRDGRLWTLDRPTGRVVGVQRESEPLTTCAAIADGHLLVGGEKGTVFAYVPGAGGLPLPPAEAGDIPQPTVPEPPPAAATPPVAVTPAPPAAAAPVSSAPPLSAPATEPATTQPAAVPTSATAAPSALTPPATPTATTPASGATAIEGPRDFPSPTAPAGEIGTAPPPAMTPTPPAAPVVTTPAPATGTPPSVPQIPLLTLQIVPADGRTPVLLVNQNTLHVGGRVTAGSGIASVRVNGLEAPIKDGEYHTQLTFPGKGQYPLLIEAVDRSGKVTPYRRDVKVLEGLDALAPDKLIFRQRSGLTAVTMVPGVRAPEAGKYRRIVEIRNAQGQLVHNWVAPGDQPREFPWNGTNANGASAPPGDYEIIYILSAAQGPVAWIRQRIEVQE